MTFRAPDKHDSNMAHYDGRFNNAKYLMHLCSISICTVIQQIFEYNSHTFEQRYVCMCMYVCAYCLHFCSEYLKHLSESIWQGIAQIAAIWIRNRSELGGVSKWTHWNAQGGRLWLLGKWQNYFRKSRGYSLIRWCLNVYLIS